MKLKNTIAAQAATLNQLQDTLYALRAATKKQASRRIETGITPCAFNAPPGLL